MKLARRQFLQLAAGAAVLPAPVSAQAYPSRPVKIIVGQAAGSASDIVARLVAQFLSEKLGQQFLVEVRPGATGNIATQVQAKVRAVMPGIVKDEVAKYLNSLVLSGRGPGRPRKVL